MNEWQLEFELNRVGRMLILVIVSIILFSLILTLLPGVKDEMQLYPRWGRGSIDSEGYVEQKSTKTIYTKTLLTLYNGVRINVGNKQQVRYKIYFYDSNENFIEADYVEYSGNRTFTYSELQRDISNDVFYYRIVITDIGDDGSVGVWDKLNITDIFKIYQIIRIK